MFYKEPKLLMEKKQVHANIVKKKSMKKKAMTQGRLKLKNSFIL